MRNKITYIILSVMVVSAIVAQSPVGFSVAKITSEIWVKGVNVTTFFDNLSGNKTTSLSYGANSIDEDAIVDNAIQNRHIEDMQVGWAEAALDLRDSVRAINSKVDTIALKLATGKFAYLEKLSTSNKFGAGLYVKIDSAFSENSKGVVYASQEAGKQWILASYQREKIITPLDFGAITDDGATTNDAEAIQRAIDFLATNSDSGGTVYVPAGKYTFKTSVYLKHRVNLVGEEGTQFRGSSGVAASLLESTIFEGHSDLNDCLVVVDSSSGVFWGSLLWQNNVLIKGITFKNGSMTSIATANAGLLYMNCTMGWKVEDCTFYGSPNHGIAINHSLGFAVNGGSAHHNAGSGVYIQGGAGDCFVTNMQLGLNNWGIYLAGGNYTTRINNNKIWNNGSGGVYVGGTSFGIMIVNNDFHDQHTKYHLRLNGLEKSIVSSNMFWAGADTLVYTSNIRGVNITANTFADAEYGIVDESSTSNSNVISSNAFYNISKNAISGIYGDYNVIQSNIGADARTDNIITTVNTNEHAIELTQNNWQKIPIDTTTNRTDSVKTINSSDSIVINNPGLYEIIGQFTVLSDSLTQIEIAPFVSDSILSAYVVTKTFYDNTDNTLSLSAYEFLSDTDFVDFRIRNTTDNGDVTVKKASTALRQLMTRDRNYITGAEIVTNGTFNTDLTGWTNISFNTFQWSSGYLNVINTTTSNEIGSIGDASRFTITAGNKYIFKFKLERNSGATKINVRWRYTQNGSIYKSWGSFSPGEYRFVHKATTTSLISISIDVTGNANWNIDDISVQQVMNP